MYLVRKYNPFKRADAAEVELGSVQVEPTETHRPSTCGSSSKRKTAERELHLLNIKIDKLLADIEEEHDTEIAFTKDDECVACLSARATMQTLPCGHRVVCRKCFIRTIQAAVKQRSLPLRCVVCRAKVLKLKQVLSRSVVVDHHLTSQQGATDRRGPPTTSLYNGLPTSLHHGPPTSLHHGPPSTFLHHPLLSDPRRSSSSSSSAGRGPPTLLLHGPPASSLVPPTMQQQQQRSLLSSPGLRHRCSPSSRVPGASSCACSAVGSSSGFGSPVVAPRSAPVTKIMQPLLIYPTTGAAAAGQATPHPRLQVRRTLAWSSTEEVKRESGGATTGSARHRRQVPGTYSPALTSRTTSCVPQRTRAQSDHRK